MMDALPRLGPLVFSENGVTPDHYLLKDLKLAGLELIN
jgi:hypothetical protein